MLCWRIKFCPILIGLSNFYDLTDKVCSIIDALANSVNNSV
jgi:hypothetical protein